MKKSILLFLLINLFGPVYLSLGQDVIVKENGEEIKSKVLEVGKDDIKYKNFEDPEFSTYTIKIEEVEKIRYEDGTEKIFKKNLVNSYVGITIGGMGALGDFGSFNTQNPGAGYAIEGKTRGSLELGVYLIKNLGLGCVFGAFNTQIDTNAIKDGYQSFDKVSFRLYEPRWRAQYMMVGPLYSFKLGKRFAIDTRFLVGPFMARKPAYGIRITSNTYAYDYDYDYGPGRGTTLGFLSGAAIRWHFSKKLGLRLGIDYIHARPRINYDVLITEYGPGFTNSRSEINNILVQRISILRFGVGIIFLFKR